jgi:hypothetical protein
VTPERVELTARQQLELGAFALLVLGAVAVSLIGAPTMVVVVVSLAVLAGLIRIAMWLVPLVSGRQP